MAHPELDMSAPLIVGFGVTSRAVARALVARGIVPVVVEDRPGDVHRQAAAELGVELIEAPDGDALAAALSAASLLLPSPGVPDHHPVFQRAAAAQLTVASEFDLAQMWDDRPVAAITGTNGKTSVTMLVTEMLNNSGRPAQAVGNTDVPFVESIEDTSTQVFVVEASSFRLAHSADFRPNVAAWLNFSPDHLDAHATLEDYEAAKASIWANLDRDATIVVNADDPVVMGHAERAVGADPDAGVEVQTFSVLNSGSTWSLNADGDVLVGPDGPFLAVSALPRSQPHDLSNALAAAAIATAVGATMEGIVESLRNFAGLSHRLEYLGQWDDVSWYNDSKATVPHATVAAVGGFDSVVLIAGGKSKGLSFDPLRDTVPPVRAVVAIGDAADEIDATFSDLVPVARADSMHNAIHAARTTAVAGDVVLLSPACASFDWYPNYVERGLDFTTLVRAEVAHS
jgi:UDP-N-acetylmuramoylalanine--D-glutamate ligase